MKMPRALLLPIAFGALLPGRLVAQGVADPTRPPLTVTLPAADATAAPPVATGLQTILRRKGARPAVIINGQYVELGGKVGDARLVQINESEVILQGPGAREELRLTPAVEKSAPVLPPAEDRPAPQLRTGRRK